MVARGGLLASPLGSLVHASLGHDAIVLIGLAVGAADWSVIIRAFEVGAISNMGQGGASLGQGAQVSVGLVVVATDIVLLLILAVYVFTLAPRAKLFKIGEHNAGVSVGLSVSRADWVVFVRTEVGRVEVLWAVPLCGEGHVLALSKAIVSIGDPVHTADRHIFVRAVGAFSDETWARPSTLERAARTVEEASVVVALSI